jgi:hypothetical protein
MSAPPGNQFWKARSSHGRKPIFTTPDALWDAASEYFEWVDQNPLAEPKPFAYQGEIRVEHIAKMRAMTIVGLCIFLDISRATWANCRVREDFAEVTQKIEDIIRTQKFEGAAADLFNVSIIQRELGLTDRADVNVSIEAISDEALDARIAELLAKAGIDAAARGAGTATRQE